MFDDERCTAEDIGGNLGGECTCGRCVRDREDRKAEERRRRAPRAAPPIVPGTIRIDTSDPTTRAIFDAAKRAKREVAEMPAWKRGDPVEPRAFYIASRLEAAPSVRIVRDALIALGMVCAYDWTIRGSVRGDPVALREVGDAEAHAVRRADVFLLMLPGGRGAHVELGIALGRAYPPATYIWSEHAEPLGWTEATSAFYHCSDVIRLLCPVEALAPMVAADVARRVPA